MSASTRIVGVLCGVLVALASAPASAQQPLEDFLRAAETGNLSLRAARAAVAQYRGQVDEARGRLLPSANASGTYQRNERQAIVNFPNPTDPANPREIVITPHDQLEARFGVSVPILDLSSWATFLASEASADAALERAGGADREVRIAVVTLWHQLVAMRSLVRAAERTLEVVESNRTAAAARVEVGSAPQLELARAEAEVQRARQAQSEAQLAATLAARSLENLTGLRPTAGGGNELEDDLHAEPALARFMAGAPDHPALRAANADVLAAERGEHAAWLTLAPTIAGQFSERLTNAAGFQGGNDQWTAGVTATWNLDFVRPAAIGTRQAVAEIARIRRDQTRLDVETAIFDAWERVNSLRVRAEAARAQLDASRRASEDARARFEAGAATQLDVIQADRDLFQAEILRIQADAELRVARLSLRIRSGVDDSTARR